MPRKNYNHRGHRGTQRGTTGIGRLEPESRFLSPPPPARTRQPSPPTVGENTNPVPRKSAPPRASPLVRANSAQRKRDRPPSAARPRSQPLRSKLFSPDERIPAARTRPAAAWRPGSPAGCSRRSSSSEQSRPEPAEDAHSKASSTE